jgi:hypothetical protein
MASQLAGSGERLMLEGDRATTMATFKAREQMAGWRRVRGRSDPCPFCLMLIGRGAVYSKNSATFQSHDRCACRAEPLYRREAEPEEVRRLSQQWSEATAGATGPEAVRAWRAFATAQQAAGRSL